VFQSVIARLVERHQIVSGLTHGTCPVLRH
jgi:hypothetical protein